MLARSRSRSRTAEAPSKNSHSVTNSLSTSPSSHSIRSKSPLSNPPDTDNLPFEPQNGMISTITGHRVAGAHDPMILNDRTAETALVEQAESRSSSLSELEVDDGSEDEIDAVATKSSVQNGSEVDSEAETERLDRTPHKGPDVADGMRQIDEKSPSKLSQEVSRENNFSDAASLASAIQLSSPVDDTGMYDNGTSPVPAEEGSMLGKRKRSTPGGSSLSDVEMDEPSPKRTHSNDEPLENDLLAYDESIKDQDAESDAGNYKVEGVLSTLDEPDASGEADDSNEGLAEEVQRAPQRGRPGRKGRRKGRKAAVVEEAENATETSDGAAQEPEDQIENDVEEEEDNSHDEELAKRKVASEALAEIEKDFTTFREQHVREQLRQVTHELELLQNPTCIHPDFLAQLKSVDERRDGKIRYEDTLLGYNLQALSIKTVAERGQFLSQYQQDARHIRDSALDNCYKELYALQKDRRRFGSDDTNSAMLYHPKRSDQIVRQTSFNLEVSILSGIAKHVGFPTAPEMSALKSNETERDLHSMGIKNPPTTQYIRTHSGSYLDESRADRSLAEVQFLEQTPWANPQHPVHAHAQANNFHAQPGSVNLTTPATQRRFVDAIATNGSASTIEMTSNPPSSAARGQYLPDHISTPGVVDSPAPPNRVLSGGLFRVGSNRQEMERIQTTHSSSARTQAAQLAAGIPQGPSASPKSMERFLHAPQAYQTVSRMNNSLEVLGGSRGHLPAGLLGNAPNGPGLSKSIGTEVLRPSPPRPVVAASVGGGGRFGP